MPITDTWQEVQRETIAMKFKLVRAHHM